MHCIELDYAFQKPGEPWDPTIKTSQPTCFLHFAPWPNDPMIFRRICAGFQVEISWPSAGVFFAKTLPTEDFFWGAPKNRIKKDKKIGGFFCWLSFKKMAASFMTQNTCPLFFVCVCVFNTGAEKKKSGGREWCASNLLVTLDKINEWSKISQPVELVVYDILPICIYIYIFLIYLHIYR